MNLASRNKKAWPVALAIAVGFAAGWWLRCGSDENSATAPESAQLGGPARAAAVLENTPPADWEPLLTAELRAAPTLHGSGSGHLARAKISVIALADRWVELDAEAAERYARSGTGLYFGRSDRTEALRGAIWTSLARRDPARPLPKTRTGVLHALRGRLLADPERALAPEALAELPSGTSLSHVAPIAGPILGDAARNMLELPDGVVSRHSLIAVFDAWSRHRPREAADALASASGHPKARVLWPTAMQSWGRSDPRSALEYCGNITDDVTRKSARSRILGDWLERAPEKALEWLRSQPREEGELFSVLHAHVYTMEPDAVAEFVRSLEAAELADLRGAMRYGGSDRHHNVHFLPLLAARDPVVALALFCELCPENILLARALGEAVAAPTDELRQWGSRIDSTAARVEFLSAAAVERATVDPEQAIAFARECGAEVLASARDGIAQSWARFDQQAALCFAAEGGDVQTLRGVLQTLRFTGDPVASFETLRERPSLLSHLLAGEGSLRFQVNTRIPTKVAEFLSGRSDRWSALAAGNLAETWLRIDFEAAQNWITERLPTGSSRDYALAKLIAHIKDDDLAEARRWATLITDPESGATVIRDLEAE